jgi:hypothetical protein
MTDARPSRRRQRPEAEIQRAVCDHLRLRAHPGVLWAHCPNGGSRDVREAVHLKRMGVLAGVSDLLLWHRGVSYALELKAPGGRLSEAQLEFLARFEKAGGYSASAEGIDQALAILEAWQLLVGKSQSSPIAQKHNAALPAGKRRHAFRGGYGYGANGLPSQQGTSGIVPPSVHHFHQPGGAPARSRSNKPPAYGTPPKASQRPAKRGSP